MTDYLRKYKSLYSSTANSFGTGTGETITPASVTGLPTDTAITLTFDRVDGAGVATPTKMERITGTISGGNFVISARGVDGTTDQAHTSPVVEMIWNAKDWNDLIDGFLVAHTQTGVHGALTDACLVTPKIVTSAKDSNGNEIFKVTATASAVNEITLTNAATGNAPVISATGDDTNINLDLKAKGTGTVRKPTSVSIQVFDGATNVATGDGKFYFTIPEELNGMNLIGVHARVITAGTTNTTDIQIANVTDSVDMLSTKLTIDSGETGSDTAATAAVIDATKDDVVTNDLLRIDVDATSTTAAKGLIVRLRFALP